MANRLRLTPRHHGMPGRDGKPSVPHHPAHERLSAPMKKRKGRRKVGRKKRRMRAKIRHRK
jgi:hypothetical protein